jgi:antitoxin component HigA of HigAB toxin-antitoxin module
MSALGVEPHVIESAAEYEEALAITTDLMLQKHRSREDDRLLKTWSILIRDYEQHRYAEMFTKSQPKDIVRFLLEENGLGQGDIPGIPQSRMSDILAGRRDVTVHQAHVLGDFFKIDFALFLT